MDWMIYGLILVMSLALRMAYPIGITFDLDFTRARLAYETSLALQGLPGNVEMLRLLISQYGIGQLAAYLPVSLSYLAFGVSDFSSLLYPLLCSLLGQGVLAWIAHRLGGRTAGWGAAFLWGIMPLEVFYATVMSSAAPFLLFNLVALACFLAALHSSGNRKRWLVGGILACGAAFVVQRAGWSLLVAGALLLAGRRADNPNGLSGKCLAVLTGLVWLVAGLLIYGSFSFLMAFPDTLFTIYESFSRSNIWFLVFPLLLMLVIAYSLQDSDALRPLLIWLAALLPFYALYVQLGEGMEKFLLPLLAPIVIGGAVSLYQCAPAGAARGGIMAAALCTALLTVLSRYAPNVLVDLQPFNLNLIFFFSKIAAGLTLLVGLSSSLWRRVAVWLSWRWTLGIVILPLLAGIAVIEPLSVQYEVARYQQGNAQPAFDWLTTASPQRSLPVYVQGARAYQQMDYLGGFTWGMKTHAGVLSHPLQRFTEQDKLADGGSAYTLITEPDFIPPVNWLLEAQTGKQGWPTVAIYRALSAIDAQVELQHTRADFQSTPVAENAQRLYAALVNAGQPCAAYQVWMQARMLDGEGGLIPLSGEANCFVEGENLIKPKRWETGIYSYSEITTVTDPQNDRPVTRVNKKKYSDYKTIYQTIPVEAGAFYLLRLGVRSDAGQPLVVPFIKLGQDEYLLETGVYPNWHERVILWATPAHIEQPQEAALSPFLLRGSYIAYFDNVRLVRVFQSNQP